MKKKTIVVLEVEYEFDEARTTQELAEQDAVSLAVHPNFCSIQNGTKLVSVENLGEQEEAQTIASKLLERSPEVTDNDQLHETIADIAFNMGWEHFDNIDSREMVRCIIQWAKEFEKAHEKTDWASKADYLEEIDEFSSTKIAEYLLGKK